MAAIFHLVLVVIVFLIGHFHIFPNSFDENGIGISFAVDGVVYRKLISDLAELLRHHGPGTWLALPAPLHCRLYSLAFVFPGSLVGHNILAAELLNLLYYLGILTFVYLLGREIFNSRTGLVAAAMIGLWPSFLLHSTQLIRDPLSILLALVLLFFLTMLLRRELSWRSTLLTSTAGIVVVVMFWLTRGNMWNVILAVVAITTLLLTIRMVRERKLLGPNLALLTVVFLTVLLVPTRIRSTTINGTPPPRALIAIPSGPPANSRSLWIQLITQVRARRGGFRIYGAQASNVDGDVNFISATDIIRYLPRAAVIGWFAPFPRMWFASGTGGRAGRMLAGLETLAMYLLYFPALLCLWRERSKLNVWLLFLVSFVGILSLGLVVVNVGALFRLRYLFWILIIVLAAGGLVKSRRIAKAGT